MLSTFYFLYGHLTRRPYEVRKQGKIDAIKQGNKVKSEKYLERT